MYPLPILTGIAIIKKDLIEISIYIIFSSLGLLVSIYHNITKFIPGQKIEACGKIPCTTNYVNFMGVITIPLLSLIAFLLIKTILSYILFKTKNKS